MITAQKLINNKKLINYVKKEIFPKYKDADGAHQLDHIQSVISFSLELAQSLCLRYDIAYLVAVFHDIGTLVDRDEHEKESGLIVLNDPFLNKHFTTNELTTIKHAVEDHRYKASAIEEPRNIYGKVVADADIADYMTVKGVLKRTWYYRKNNPKFQFLEKDREIFNDMYSFIQQKFLWNIFYSYFKYTRDNLKPLYDETCSIAKQKDFLYEIFKEMRNNGELE